MPSADKNLILIDLFISLESAGTNRQKSELLGKAKNYIFNQMDNLEAVDFFTKDNKKNFEYLFNLDIWTPSLDAANSVVNFLEPYDIIQRIFTSFESLRDFIDNFGEQIRFLLHQNKDENIKHLCVKHFTYLALHIDFSNEENQVAAKDELESKIKQILPQFVTQIPFTTVAYTQLLTDLFCKLIIKLEHIHRRLHEDIFSCSIFENNPELINEFDKVSNMNSIQYFRVLEFIIHIGCLSNDCLVSICDLRFNLNERINKYLKHSNDILSQLNCIELITNIIKTNHGFEYAEKNNYLSFMLHLLENSDSNPIASIIVPPIIKLFGILAHERPMDIFYNYSNYYEFLFKLTQLDYYIMDNLTSIELSIETFIYLFESNIVKQFFLENYESSLYRLMEKLVEIVNRCINTKLKSNAIICLSEILASDASLLQTFETDTKWSKSAWVTDKWIQMGQQLYKQLNTKVSHEELFKLCLNLARQPFMETRIAAQCYFKSLAQTKWGLIQIFSPNGFNRPDEFIDGYILKRDIEQEKQGLESKYELLKLLVANFTAHPDLIELIGDTYLEKMRLYIREGPFYSRAEYKIAFESN